MLMQNLLVFSSSSSSPPIYRAPARLTRQNSHCVHLASRKTSSSSTSSANNRPLLFLVLLFHASDHVFLFHARPVRESEEGSEEGAVLVPVRGGRRHRPPEHRRLRAPEPGPVSPARRVLRLQARRIPRPPPPGLRDRHLHARRGLHPPGLLWPQGHHQDRRCPVDDGRARHRALGDAGSRRRAEGPAALDQPRLQRQDVCIMTMVICI
uniref:Uncharacterized protein n=1 Tax=Triticum urartu TaxID=4572 RepID=A0A8R7QAA6_TRIUA